MDMLTLPEVYSGYWIEENADRYADRVRFMESRGTFLLLSVKCHSGVDGTCQCNAHDTYHEQELLPGAALELLKEWGYRIEDQLDWSKIRRRVEDALRKTTDRSTMFSIAKMLNMKLD